MTNINLKLVLQFYQIQENNSVILTLKNVRFCYFKAASHHYFCSICFISVTHGNIKLIVIIEIWLPWTGNWILNEKELESSQY